MLCPNFEIFCGGLPHDFFQILRKLKNRHRFHLGGHRAEDNADFRIHDHPVMLQQRQVAGIKAIRFPLFAKFYTHNIFQRIILPDIQILRQV
jgi:hypothetical protein